MYILGIHDGHNASVALMKNGRIIDAIQEERFNRIKNFGGYPKKSIQYILKKNNLDFDKIDEFVFASKISYYKGLENRENVMRKFESNFYSSYSFFHYLKKKFHKISPNYLKDYTRKKRFDNISKIRSKELISEGVNLKKISFIEHHLCHASSAAYGSGNEKDTLVITLDSSGDYSSGSVNIFKKGSIEKILDIPSDDSLGRLYSYITYYLGMVPLEHEYKIMGMAPYSETSRYSKEISHIFRSMYYFDSDISFKISNKIKSAKNLGKFIEREIKQKRFDHVSAGLQIFLEEFVCEWIQKLIKHTKIKNLALGGGIFMNVKLNKRILELDCVDNMFIFPSCGDETNCFGYTENKIYSDHWESSEREEEEEFFNHR